MHFELFVGRDGQFYIRLVAVNGQILLSSEGYTRLVSAEHTLSGIAKNLMHDAGETPVMMISEGYEKEPVEIRTLSDYVPRGE